MRQKQVLNRNRYCKNRTMNPMRQKQVARIEPNETETGIARIAMRQKQVLQKPNETETGIARTMRQKQVFARNRTQ